MLQKAPAQSEKSTTTCGVSPTPLQKCSQTRRDAPMGEEEGGFRLATDTDHGHMGIGCPGGGEQARGQFDEALVLPAHAAAEAASSGIRGTVYLF